MTSHLDRSGFIAAEPVKLITQSIARLLHTVAAKQRRRQAIRDLRELEDYMLEDIGLSRGEIARAVRQPATR